MAYTLWMWLIGGLIVLGYVLPYTLLTDIEHWHGAFLFWIVFGIAVWIILSVTVLRWTATAADIDAASEEPRQ